MKVLFLDIDGVLNLKCESETGLTKLLADKAIRILNN